MTLPALVTVEDFAEWIERSFDDAQTARAGRVLAIASALTRGAAGSSLAWILVDEDGVPILDGDGNAQLTDVPDDIAGIVLQAAERKWKNPEGAIAVAQGPFSKRYPEAAASGIYLTEEEEEVAGGYRPSTQAAKGLWTLSTTRGDDWAALMDPFSLVPTTDSDGNVYADPFLVDAPLGGLAWIP